jgi:hypothetical protein
MDAKQAVIQILKAVYETIVEAGPMGAPAGHLYAALMTTGCTLDQYQQIETLLISTGKVRKSGHVLYAV